MAVLGREGSGEAVMETGRAELTRAELVHSDGRGARHHREETGPE